MKRKRWIYDERYGTIGSIFNEDGDQVAQAMQLIPVHGPEDLEPRRATSRLIAAAPEMADLCDEIANHLYTKQDFDRVRQMVKAVLGKL